MASRSITSTASSSSASGGHDIAAASAAAAPLSVGWAGGGVTGSSAATPSRSATAFGRLASISARSATALAESVTLSGNARTASWARTGMAGATKAGSVLADGSVLGLRDSQGKGAPVRGSAGGLDASAGATCLGRPGGSAGAMGSYRTVGRAPTGLPSAGDGVRGLWALTLAVYAAWVAVALQPLEGPRHRRLQRASGAGCRRPRSLAARDARTVAQATCPAYGRSSGGVQLQIAARSITSTASRSSAVGGHDIAAASIACGFVMCWVGSATQQRAGRHCVRPIGCPRRADSSWREAGSRGPGQVRAGCRQSGRGHRQIGIGLCQFGNGLRQVGRESPCKVDSVRQIGDDVRQADDSAQEPGIRQGPRGLDVARQPGPGHDDRQSACGRLEARVRRRTGAAAPRGEGRQASSNARLARDARAAERASRDRTARWAVRPRGCRSPATKRVVERLSRWQYPQHRAQPDTCRCATPCSLIRSAGGLTLVQRATAYGLRPHQVSSVPAHGRAMQTLPPPARNVPWRSSRWRVRPPGRARRRVTRPAPRSRGRGWSGRPTSSRP